KLRLLREELRLRERLEAQLVGGVRRVGDQLAQEDLLVAVQRMDHEVQELPHLGLESQGLSFFDFAHRHPLERREAETIRPVERFSRQRRTACPGRREQSGDGRRDQWGWSWPSPCDTGSSTAARRGGPVTTARYRRIT